MIKVTHNNTYVDKQDAIKKAKVDEQYRELKSIIPEQGLMKRRIEIIWGDEIIIRDRRHRSMSSTSLVHFLLVMLVLKLHDFMQLKKRYFLLIEVCLLLLINLLKNGDMIRLKLNIKYKNPEVIV